MRPPLGERSRPALGRLLLFSALVILPGCRKRAPLPGDGAFKDGAYANPYFGFTLRVPAGWTVRKAPETMSRFLQYFLRLMAAQGDEKSDALRIVPLARLSTDPKAGLKEPKDAILAAAAADLGAKALTFKRALALAEILVKNSGVPAKFRGEPHNALLGGLHGAGFETELAFKEKPLFEATRFVFRQRHVVVFHISAISPEGLQTGLDVLDSIRWAAPAQP